MTVMPRVLSPVYLLSVQFRHHKGTNRYHQRQTGPGVTPLSLICPMCRGRFPEKSYDIYG